MQRPKGSNPKKFLYVDFRLAQDSTQRSFRHIPGVARDRDLTSGLFVPPKLVTARSLPVEDVPECAQPSYDLPVLESREPTH